MSPSQLEMLTSFGWSVVSEAPLELSHPNGSQAKGIAASVLMQHMGAAPVQERQGHAAYIAELDEDQLASLIALATTKRENLRNGGWTSLWVVGDYANQGWFAKDDYAKAAEFMGLLIQKHIAAGQPQEMTLEPGSYRPAEAQRLVEDSEKELLALRKKSAR